MSGGSLNYLCYKEPVELFNHLEDLEMAEQYLLAKDYKDIAADVRRLMEYIKSAENRIGVLAEQLNNVLHAVEWYISADYGEDTLRKALEEYRTGKTEKEAAKV